MTGHDELDPLTMRRAARLSALLDADLRADDAIGASAERMRPAVLAAARRAQQSAQRRTLLKAAAVVLVAIGVVAAPPARAWVVDATRQLVSALGLAWTDAAPGEPQPALPADADVRYAFDVAGPTLTLRIDASGELVIRRADNSAAAVETTDAPGTRVVILPEGVSITGTTDQPGARFTVTVPAHVSTVQVVLPDGSSQVVTVGAAPATVRVVR